MSLSAATLNQLGRCAATGATARTDYYQLLERAGDPYGRMALGVVLQSNMAGEVAYSYACEVGKRYCRPLDSALWVTISTELMRRDYAARLVPDAYEQASVSLKYEVIAGYHRDVFATVAELPPLAWTAWIPLLLDGEAKDQKLWHRMLHEGFVVIGVQVAWLALGRVLHDDGVTNEMAQSVVPTLQYSPPVVTGQQPADPAFERCMARLAPYQLQEADASSRERLAAFYLSVLASSVNAGFVADVWLSGGLALPITFGDVFGRSWLPSVGDVDRALP